MQFSAKLLQKKRPTTTRNLRLPAWEAAFSVVRLLFDSRAINQLNHVRLCAHLKCILLLTMVYRSTKIPLQSKNRVRPFHPRTPSEVHRAATKTRAQPLRTAWQQRLKSSTPRRTLLYSGPARDVTFRQKAEVVIQGIHSFHSIWSTVA